MKKIAIPVFSCLIVLTLLLGSAGIARAEGIDEPVVTPVSGDMVFTTSFIPIAEFPGTTEFNQMLVPVGFPGGEAQYEGDGVIVSGLENGIATACFTVTGTQWGWGGKVALWNGTKWEKLATTITTPEDSPSSVACASINVSGTYVFIKYVTNPDLLPKYTPLCSEQTFSIPVVMPAMYNWFKRTWLDGYLWLGVGGNILYSDKLYAIGTPVTFELLESTPADIFTMPLKTTGTITSVYGPMTHGPLTGLYMYSIGYSTQKFTFLGRTFPGLQYKVTLPECYFDGTFPPEMEISD